MANPAQIRPSQIKQSGASSGQVLSWNGSEWAPAAAGGGLSDPTTTKGDLITRTSSALTRLGVGTDGQVLTADSTQAAGLKWATPATGGGSLTQAYVGKNAVGASFEAMTGRRTYMKKITLSASRLLTDIEAYLDWGNVAETVNSVNFALFADNAGSPRELLATSSMPGLNIVLDNTANATVSTLGRWFSGAIGRWLTAGDYWISVQARSNGSSMSARVAYDTSGTDRYYDSGGDWFTDSGFYAVTTSTRDYSIRANTIG